MCVGWGGVRACARVLLLVTALLPPRHTLLDRQKDPPVAHTHSAQRSVALRVLSAHTLGGAGTVCEPWPSSTPLLALLRRAPSHLTRHL